MQNQYLGKAKLYRQLKISLGHLLQLWWPLVAFMDKHMKTLSTPSPVWYRESSMIPTLSFHCYTPSFSPSSYCFWFCLKAPVSSQLDHSPFLVRLSISHPCSTSFLTEMQSGEQESCHSLHFILDPVLKFSPPNIRGHDFCVKPNSQF